MAQTYVATEQELRGDTTLKPPEEPKLQWSVHSWHMHPDGRKIIVLWEATRAR